MLAVLCAVACGGRAARPPTASAPKHPTLDGAVLVALPGVSPAFVVSGTTADVVRGRVRWRLDADGGATRLREVTAEPIASATALPTWLGGGVAYVLDDGLAFAAPNGVLRPVLRGRLTSLSIGAHEVWARERVSNDWLRIDLGGKLQRTAPPIAAPILAAWSSAGTVSGRGLTAGPEYFGPTTALAIVDLLGPVLSRDGGDTWSPLDPALVRAAFPDGGPKRIVRDGTQVALASDDRAALVGSSGTLGAPTPLAKAPLVPEIATIRVESIAPFGVPLPGGVDEILVADAGRFAVVLRDPLRVSRLSRAGDLGGCELSAASTEVLAACARHGQGAYATGGQLVIGALRGLDAGVGGPQLDVEKAFAFGTGHRFSVSSAVAVAASCVGGSEGGLDLLSATKVCVRDRSGQWTELGIGSVSGRRHVVPRADGGVTVVREDAGGAVELLALPRGAAATTAPLRVRLGERARDLIAIDEIAPGRLMAWFRTITELRALVIAVDDTTIRVVESLPRAVLDGKAFVGTWGDRAMVFSLTDGPAKKDMHVEASVTVDGGRKWSYAAWPTDVGPTDTSAAAKRVECGAIGCRTLGWSRLGWQPTVAVHDSVLDLSSAPPIPPAPSPTSRATTIVAKCSSVGTPQLVPPAQVPIAPTVYPFQSNDVLLGMPAAKLAKDQSQVLTPIGRNVRGGLISTGPTAGPWGDSARTVLRFSSDLDSLGSVNDTAPFALFADRAAAANAGWTLRPIAWALGPKRVVLALCSYGRCDAWRASPSVPPERIDLGSVVVAQSILGVRELGSVLAVLGMGWPIDGARTADPRPFVALASPQGTTASFLARASWSSESQMAMSVEPIRGAVGVLELTTSPAWTHGTGYVLPIGVDAHPAGAFELLAASTPDVVRPANACGSATPGWDDGDATVGRKLSLTIDGTPHLLRTEAGVLRTRMGASDACLERVTALFKRASFQLDPHSGKALFYELPETSATGRKTELTCTIGWGD